MNIEYIHGGIEACFRELGFNDLFYREYTEREEKTP